MLNRTNSTCLLPPPPPHRSVTIPVVSLICSSSVVCVLVLIHSLRRNQDSFFKMKLINRVAVYAAISDILFYTPQAAMIIMSEAFTSNTVQMITSIITILFMEFAYSQILTGIVIAGSVLIVVTKNEVVSFGKFDWKLHLTVFGVPFVVLTVLEAIDKISVKPKICELPERALFFTVYTVAILVSITAIVIIYTIVWYYVSRIQRTIRTTLQQQTNTNTKRLVLKLSLYVLCYLVQFGGNAVEGIWRLFEEPPNAVRDTAVLIVTSGGVLNGLVYYIIQEVISNNGSVRKMS